MLGGWWMAEYQRPSCHLLAARSTGPAGAWKRGLQQREKQREEKAGQHTQGGCSTWRSR